MFERLYVRPIVRTHHITSPLADERIAYLRHLEGQGASKRRLCDVAGYLLVIVERLSLANRPSESISVDEIEQQAATWARRVGGHTPGERLCNHRPALQKSRISQRRADLTE